MSWRTSKSPRIYNPGPNITQQIESLTSAIANRPPYCSGTVPVSTNDLLLFYRKPSAGKNLKDRTAACCLDLSDSEITDDAFDDLVSACETTTYRRSSSHPDSDASLASTDVSNRIASGWKLDPVYFSSKLNIVHAGLTESIRYNLLQGEEGKMAFFAELTQLNVYGQGLLSKPHRVELKGDRMFGSLLIVLPTMHEGGTIVLRHGEKEWNFQSDQLPLSSIMYFGVYGDVEQEILDLKSGYLLTLSYDLYFGDSLDSQAVTSLPSTVSDTLYNVLPSNFAAFLSQLSVLLADDTFLPLGGFLGFGLFHGYHSATHMPEDMETEERKSFFAEKLSSISEILKGNDSVIVQACHALGLTCTLFVSYEGRYLEEDFNKVALCRVLPDLDGEYIQDAVWEHLKKYSARYVSLANSDNETRHQIRNDEEEYSGAIDLNNQNFGQSGIDFYVHWVSKLTSYNRFKFTAQLEENPEDSSVLEGYGRLCLIASLGPPGRRNEDPPTIV